MWYFQISAGRLSNSDPRYRPAPAYSGHPPHVNDPAAVALTAVGPIPPGLYRIGAPLDPPDHLGPLALPLTPIGGQDMHGRTALFLHGDNAARNQTASHGCIIADKDVRLNVNTARAAGDDRLQVIL
jgi:hypothetical protein